MRRKSGSLGRLLLAAVLMVPLAAAASPRLTGFGPGMDLMPGYEGQTKCSPSAKPGVVAFQQEVLAEFPFTGAGGISRDCSIGGKSEHKEGRAWDWGVNVSNPAQKEAADKLILRLTKSDRYGNPAALARRVGIMYIIWNREIWFPGSGWRTYCVQKKNICHTPGDTSSARHPHTDHVHFSFTWAGAKKRTTFWKPDRSFASDIVGSPTGSGYWVASRHGGVAAFGAGFYGSAVVPRVRAPITSMVPSPSGSGYRLLNRRGKVFTMGDARWAGDARGKKLAAVDMAATRSGKGYWIVAQGGRVLAYGDADVSGRLKKVAGDPVVGIAGSEGGGYWLARRSGTVAAFGNAAQRNDLSGRAEDVAGILASPSGKGYWLFTRTGRVAAYGDAQHLGDLSEALPPQPIVAMAATASGAGYRLVTNMGKVYTFGEAEPLGNVRTMGRSATFITQRGGGFPTDPAEFPDH